MYSLFELFFDFQIVTPKFMNSICLPWFIDVALKAYGLKKSDLQLPFKSQKCERKV